MDTCSTPSPKRAAAHIIALAVVAMLFSGCGKKPQPDAVAAQKTTGKTAEQTAEGAAKKPVDPAEKPETKKPLKDDSAPSLQGTGVHGKVKFKLMFSPPKPRVGELFKVITLAAEVTSSKAVMGAEVVADATMPHHGHGMMTEPKHSEIGGGAYQHEGFKLHMHGEWTFDVKLKRGELEDRFKAVWQQAPEAL